MYSLLGGIIGGVAASYAMRDDKNINGVTTAPEDVNIVNINLKIDEINSYINDLKLRIDLCDHLIEVNKQSSEYEIDRINTNIETLYKDIQSSDDQLVEVPKTDSSDSDGTLKEGESDDTVVDDYDLDISQLSSMSCVLNSNSITEDDVTYTLNITGSAQTTEFDIIPEKYTEIISTGPITVSANANSTSAIAHVIYTNGANVCTLTTGTPYYPGSMNTTFDLTQPRSVANSGLIFSSDLMRVKIGSVIRDCVRLRITASRQTLSINGQVIKPNVSQGLTLMRGYFKLIARSDTGTIERFYENIIASSLAATRDLYPSILSNE